MVVYEQLAAEGYIETSQGAVAKVAAGIAAAGKASVQKPSGVGRAPILSAYSRRANQFDLQIQKHEIQRETRAR